MLKFIKVSATIQIMADEMVLVLNERGNQTGEKKLNVRIL